MDWSIIAAVHRDEAVLENTFLRSPALGQARRILCQRGFSTVSAAYNAALHECNEDVLVFAHPDVYLPAAWTKSFYRSLEWLSRTDPDWGVLGHYGVGLSGARHGFAFSTGLGRYVGQPFSTPCLVRTVDEFAFAIRRRALLSFDEALPSAQFQLGATDLCLQAESRGLRNYAVPCFAVHNSNHWSYLPMSFLKSYLYIRRKWKKSLPIQAPYAKITADCWPMVKTTLQAAFSCRRSCRRMTRVSDPSLLYDKIRHDVLTCFAG